MTPEMTSDAAGLPTTGSGLRATGWWGMVVLIATEATLFAALLSSYFSLRSGADVWPPAGVPKPEFSLAGPGTAILLSSSATMVWAELSIRRGRQGRLRAGMAVTSVLGLVFLAIQSIEYATSEFTPRTNAYGSLFFIITGIHGLHVAVGLCMLAVVQLRAWLRHFDAERNLAVQNVSLYWHFVDAVWIFVFASLYISPRVI
ncbi:MAG: heme-copper oxidase subunit III [Dehalococcoidia bacterium]|nr:heme-copper oxidase subunit III [Dehalococcoidia bacterium]